MQILHKTISFLHLSYDFEETLSFYIERIRDKNLKPQLTFWSFSYFFYFFPHPLYIFFNQIYKSNFWAVVPRHNVPSVPLFLPAWFGLIIIHTVSLSRSPHDQCHSSVLAPGALVRDHNGQCLDLVQTSMAVGIELQILMMTQHSTLNSVECQRKTRSIVTKAL